MQRRATALLCFALTGLSSTAVAASTIGQISSGTQLGNGKVYFFFENGYYASYDAKAEVIDHGHPMALDEKWPAIPRGTEITAAFLYNRKAYLFSRGGQYWRLDVPSDTIDAGYPKPIKGNWGNLWSDRVIQGAINWNGTQAFFFSGPNYVRYDLTKDVVDGGYPKVVEEHWKGLVVPAGQRITAVVDGFANGKVYFFFSNGTYARFDVATDAVDAAPRAIRAGWSLPEPTSSPPVISSYASATRAGPASIENLVCTDGNGFPDLGGSCWRCPDGYAHDNLLLAPTDGKVCKKSARSKGIDRGCTVGDRGCWLSGVTGFRCPSGYTHNTSYVAEDDRVCTKESYSSATKLGGSVACTRGFFDPIDGGTCWTCPIDQPIRNLRESVKSAKACATKSCGGNRQRPCQLTERVPSCNIGLVENLVTNKCGALPSTYAVCKSVIDSVLGKKSKSSFEEWKGPFIDSMKKGVKALDDASKKAMTSAANASRVGSMKKYVAELNLMKPRISTDAIKALFSDSERICAGDLSAVEAKLGEAFRPSAAVLSMGDLRRSNERQGAHGPWSGEELSGGGGGHFFMEIGIVVSSAVGVGAFESLSFVTDFKGNTVALWSYGGGLTTNVKAEIADFVIFYPSVTVDDFGGSISEFSSWNWELSMAGGVIAGGGLTFTYDHQMGVHPELGQSSITPQGIGLTLGLSLDLLPAEGAVAASYAYRIATN